VLLAKGMRKNLLTIALALALSVNALAAPAGPGSATSLNSDRALLSSKIGSTMFAYYEVNYHDQLAAIVNLSYCGAEDVANKVIRSVPDLPSFYLQPSSRQLLTDLIDKEAIKNGYALNNEEDFQLISHQSLIKGQAYFAGYLNGYQTALQKFPRSTAKDPFCQAALVEAKQFLPDN